MVHIEDVDEAAAKPKAVPIGSEWLAELPLAGGPIVRFRHVRPDDEPAITEAIRTASRQTLLHRFFSPIRSVSPAQMRQMLCIDRAKELCVVGVVEGDGGSRVICGARYVRLPTPATAEIAFTVHDDFQRRGLGTFLLKLLSRLAAADGILRFEADVMASNRAMLNLFNKAVKNLSSTWQLGVTHLAFELSNVAMDA
jgi:RimJ/RimL family protein N-acetyltransferase